MRWRRSWPLALAGLLVTAVSVYFRQSVVGLCGGAFVYPVDDTYIHIALAKNIVANGVWGVEPGECAFCSSSPFWTVLLSLAYLVVGVCEDIPWCLAHVFNLLTLWVFDRSLHRHAAPGPLRLVLLLSLAVSAPFFCTTALGMEHSAHAFFLLATIVFLDESAETSGRGLTATFIFAFLAAATRYESLFVLLPIFLGTGIVRRDVRLVFPMVGSILPIAVYGVIAVVFGGMFLPNSLMLKGNFMSLGDVIAKTLGLFVEIPPFCDYLYYLAVSLLLTALLPGVRQFWRMAAVSVVVAIAGHLVFAKVIIQLCRYESYLMSVGVLVLFGAMVTALNRNRLVNFLRLAVPCALMMVFTARALMEYPYVVRSSEDIYSQQVQMTRIMASLPPECRGRVAINDLGYFSLHSGLPILDMWGLGTQAVAEEIVHLRKCGKDVSADALTVLSDRYGVRYGVFFESWYPSGLRPAGLRSVGRLHLKNNFICGSDSVTFFVRHEEDADVLRSHLSRFVDKLPPRATLELLHE